MNAGTGVGVVMAIPFALTVSIDTWQMAWAMFSIIVLLLGITSVFVVPAKSKKHLTSLRHK